MLELVFVHFGDEVETLAGTPEVLVLKQGEEVQGLRVAEESVH